MNSIYKHLSLTERVKIEVLHRYGVRPAHIAEVVGRHRSTIGREIERARRWAGRVAQGYVAHFGLLSYQRGRRLAGSSRRKLGCDLRTPLWRNIILHLQQGWSPEQYAGQMRAQFSDGADGFRHKLYASHPTIYQGIRDLPPSPQRGWLTRLLRQSTGGRRKRRRGARHTGLRNITTLDKRSAQANERTEFGHWEGDLIKGANNRSAMGTLVERMSRFTLLVPLQSAAAKDVYEGFVKALKGLPGHARRSLTYDRGTEMAMHEQLTKRLSMPVFFCEPYSPGQRGTNENTNGLLRQYFPKGTDLSVHSPVEIKRVQRLLNQRPRRILGFCTPDSRFEELLEKGLQAAKP